MQRIIKKDNNIYTFTSTQVDGSQISELRRQLANKYLRCEFEYGLTPNIVSKCYDEMDKIIHADSKANDIKLSEIGRFIYTLQTRAKYNINKDTLIWLACIYFKLSIKYPDNSIEEEPNIDTNGFYDKLKYDIIINSNEDDILFFCQKALKYTSQLENISNEDLPVFLQEVDEILNLTPMPTLT